MSWDERHGLALAALRPGSTTNAPRTSVMREVLDNQTRFTWPDGSTKLNLSTKHNPYIVKDNRNLDEAKKSTNATVLQYRCNVDTFRRDGPAVIPFKHSFAVKRFLGPVLENKEKAREEVENMDGLAHPHVALLLGTYTQDERLHLLIFPAASCDLGQFMDCVSEQLKIRTENMSVRELPLTARNDVRVQGGPSHRRPNRSSTVSSIHSQPGPVQRIEYDWPKKAPLADQLNAIHGFYYCILSAVQYLFEQAIRHKDFKPANFLVDLSGSVVVTDFGISKRFNKKDRERQESDDKVMQITQDQKPRLTRGYAAPESLENVPRDEKAEIFSVGCVFLEMLTLELGLSLDTCRSYQPYAKSLDKVRIYMNTLETLAKSDNTAKHQELQRAVSCVKNMLEETPSARLSAKELIPHFDFPSVSACHDCNERSGNAWRPTPAQAAKEVESQMRRASHPATSSFFSVNGLRSLSGFRPRVVHFDPNLNSSVLPRSTSTQQHEISATNAAGSTNPGAKSTRPKRTDHTQDRSVHAVMASRGTEPKDNEKVIVVDLQSVPKNHIMKYTFVRGLGCGNYDISIQFFDLDPTAVEFLIPTDEVPGGVFKLDLKDFGFFFNRVKRLVMGRYSKVCLLSKAESND